MTIVIAGGSGMLMDATKWIKEHFDDDIWLLSRNQNKYSEDLLHSKIYILNNMIMKMMMC